MYFFLVPSHTGEKQPLQEMSYKTNCVYQDKNWFPNFNSKFVNYDFFLTFSFFSQNDTKHREPNKIPAINIKFFFRTLDLVQFDVKLRLREKEREANSNPKSNLNVYLTQKQKNWPEMRPKKIVKCRKCLSFQSGPKY